MNAEQAKALREPFKPEQIGHIPKAGIMLDYVGHAVTTNRLLEVDSDWTWYPFSPEERASVCAKGDELWIWLTVCGVSRPGVGDGETAKIRIGDAIRNAAMRFGVALDLWAKEDLGGEPAPKSPAVEAVKSSYAQPKRDTKPDEEALKLAGTLVQLATDLGAGPATREQIAKNLANNALPQHKAWLKRQIGTATKSLEEKTLGAKVA